MEAKELKEIKSKLIEGIKWDSKRPKETGGQQCGIPVYPVILSHEDLGIEIIIGCHRQNHKNKELALTLFELAIDDIIK